MKMNEYLNRSQAAKYLGVTPAMLRNWDKSGRFLATRNPFNSYRMYKIEDLDNVLKQLKGE
jgi:DNA-binding transcriptional MerR regulator